MFSVTSFLFVTAIDAEKKEQEFRKSITGFDKMQLKSPDGAGDSVKERSKHRMSHLST